MIYNTILYYTILYCTILYNTVLYYTPYYTILYYTILYHTIQYCTTLFNFIQYYTKKIQYKTRKYKTTNLNIFRFSLCCVPSTFRHFISIIPSTPRFPDTFLLPVDILLLSSLISYFVSFVAADNFSWMIDGNSVLEKKYSITLLLYLSLSLIFCHPSPPSDHFLACFLSLHLTQHTGSAADLICETLKKANEFVHKRRINPRAKPMKPFKINLPENYV